MRNHIFINPPDINRGILFQGIISENLIINNDEYL